MKPYERITKQKECCSLVTRACTAVRQLMFSDGQEIGCSCRVGEDSGGGNGHRKLNLQQLHSSASLGCCSQALSHSVMYLLGIQQRRSCKYEMGTVIWNTDFSRPSSARLYQKNRNFFFSHNKFDCRVLNRSVGALCKQRTFLVTVKTF
jgi:hypothetical protein